MGKEIFEVSFENKHTPIACYIALREQILATRYTRFPRTSRGLAKAKLRGSIGTVFPDETPPELKELNDAYKLRASEQLKSVILDLAYRENVRLARERNVAPKPLTDFTVDPENDCPLMVFYKETLAKQDIPDINTLNQLEQIVDFRSMEDDEDVLEIFEKTRSSSGTLLFDEDVGFEKLTEEHQKIVDFNKNPDEPDHTPLQEQVATEILIRSLGFGKQDLEDIEKCIGKDDEPTQKAKSVRAAVEAYVAKKVDAASAGESEYVDAYKNCDLLVKHYLSEKYGFTTLDYMNAREEDYAEKLYEKISPVAEAKFIRDRFDSLKVPTAESEPSERDKYMHDVVDCIKHLETVHAKRGFFTRFVDWFRSNGENSTVNAMKSQLTRLGFTASDISTAKKFSTAPIPNGIGEYADGTTRSTTFTGADFDQKLYETIDNYIPEEVKQAAEAPQNDLFDKFNSPDAFKDEPDLEEDLQSESPEQAETAPETVTEADTQSLKNAIASTLQSREGPDTSVTGKVNAPAEEAEKERINK